MHNELKNLSRKNLAKFILALPDPERNYKHVSAITGRSVETLRRHYKDCFQPNSAPLEQECTSEKKDNKQLSREDIAELILSLPDSERNYQHVSKITGRSVDTIRRHYKDFFKPTSAPKQEQTIQKESQINEKQCKVENPEDMGNYFNHFFGALVEQVKSLQSTVFQLQSTVEELKKTCDSQKQTIKTLEESIPQSIKSVLTPHEDNKKQSFFEDLVYSILNKNFYFDIYRRNDHLKIQPSWKIGENKKYIQVVGYKTEIICKTIGPQVDVYIG